MSSSGTTIEPSRRSQLNGARLTAAVQKLSDQPIIETLAGAAYDGPAGGAAVRLADDSLWLLIDAPMPTGLGAGLVWLQRQAASRSTIIHPVRDGLGGLDATCHSIRVACVTDPPDMYTLVDRLVPRLVPPSIGSLVSGSLTGVATLAPLDIDANTLHPAAAALADAARERYADDADRRVSVERDPSGDLLARFTLLGLEVARMLDREGSIWFEVGVSERDRHARHELIGSIQLNGSEQERERERALDTLAQVVEVVSKIRAVDGLPHPIRDEHPLGLLAHRIRTRPQLVSVEGSLRPVVLEPRHAADRSSWTASTSSWTSRALLGDRDIVVCAMGLHLDVVLEAAQWWAHAAADRRAQRVESPRLIVAMPERNALRAHHLLLSMLRPELSAVIRTV